MVSVPVTRIAYRQACYDVSVPSCSVNSCGPAGYCDQGQSVCSQTEFNTNTVCPLNNQQPGVVGGVQGVQDVQGVGVQGVGVQGLPGQLQQNCQQVSYSRPRLELLKFINSQLEIV